MIERATLVYARPPSRRERWGWRALLVAAILVTGVAGWRQWPALDRWQSLARLRHAVLTATVGGTGPAVVVTPADGTVSWLKGLGVHAPDERLWRRGHAALAPLLPAEPGPPVLLFMHERSTPAGARRVVVLQVDPISFPDMASASLYVRLFDPGTVLHPALREIVVGPVVGLKLDGTIPGFPGVRCGLARVPWGHAFTLSAGRADAADASQVLLDYTLDRHAGRIIARLGNDDGITFRTADGAPLPIRPVRAVRPLAGRDGRSTLPSRPHGRGRARDPVDPLIP